MKTKSVSTSELKTHCSSIVDAVAKQGRLVVITKRGRPVAKLVPFEDEASRSLFGFAKGTITIHGDIRAPIDEHWNAQGS